MFYPFPIINHIDQVKEAIHSRDEFIIGLRPEGFSVANYLVNMGLETFPSIVLNEIGEYATKQDELYAIRRECRGIKFNTSTGEVLARPYHKFFNVGERDETSIQNIELLKNPHFILYKMDGSMIHPVKINDEIYWCTKMGVTDVVKPVEQFIKQNKQYAGFSSTLLDQGLTPIFEWCSRRQRIVIDYPEDRLVLTAVRDSKTGKYSTYDAMRDMSDMYKIECVKYYKGSDGNIENLISYTKGLKNEEGFVIRFSTGGMTKLKAEEYLKIHKSKDKLRFEKDVIDLIISQNIDDVKAFLQESDLNRVNEFETKFWTGVNSFINYIEETYKLGKQAYGNDRKKFAVEFATKQSKLIKGLMFQLFADKSARDCVIDIIKKNIGSQSAVDSIREIFNTNWNPVIAEE